MNALIRPIAVVIAVLIALAVLSLWGPHFACDSARQLLREYRRGARLQELEQDPSESRVQVVCELIAQQCSLKEALARLQELDSRWPDSPAPFDMDRTYRWITTIAKDLLQDRPDEASVILRRLEKDYQQLQTNTQTPSTVPMERTERHR
jgi:hypothetical protein